MGSCIGTQQRAQEVTKLIARYRIDFEELGTLFTSPTRGTKTRGQDRVIYDLDESQAIFLVTLMGNSRKVVEFKKTLAIEFVPMRKLLLEKQTPEWQLARQQSKQIRLQETDAIKELVGYARDQGSKHAVMLYMNYSKLVKKLAEYQDRDSTDADTLLLVMTFERMLEGIIYSEMALNTHYKEIYKKAKQQLQSIKMLWGAPKLTA